MLLWKRNPPYILLKEPQDQESYYPISIPYQLFLESINCAKCNIPKKEFIGEYTKPPGFVPAGHFSTFEK
jgi:hypothetical protein